MTVREVFLLFIWNNIPTLQNMDHTKIKELESSIMCDFINKKIPNLIDVEFNQISNEEFNCIIRFLEEYIYLYKCDRRGLLCVEEDIFNNTIFKFKYYLRINGFSCFD